MKQPNEYNRRDFLKGSSVAALMAMMGGVELRAGGPETASATNWLTPEPIGRPVKFGVIGLGPWGREILSELARLPNTPVVAISDKYPTALRRSGETLPKAQRFDDWSKLIECKDVEAVVISTPTHVHKEMAVAALQAGKHVYCEAPLSNSIEDAKAIASAAKAADRQVFQTGLQKRCHPHRRHILGFIRAGAAGTPVLAHAQWHRKRTWAIPSANPEREKEINWRLDKKLTTGLAGEVGIHQIDLVNWLWGARPAAITGFGALISNRDGREVDDNVQAIFEYRGGAKLIYEATLSNSFDSEYEMLYGTDAAIMMRVLDGAQRGWMFKEVDSSLLGWEVYARKDNFFGETGIVLRAGATKQDALGNKPVAEDKYPNSALYYALESYTRNVISVADTVADYLNTFGDSDEQALRDKIAANKPKPVPGWKEGYEATVLAIKANEAICKRERVVIHDDLFAV